MYKKTLLSLAVASSVALTGCFEDAETGTNAGSRANIQDSEFQGKTWPQFNPVTEKLPVPTDIQFAGTEDGTLSGSDDNAITQGLDALDGVSTTAQYDIKLNSSIDPDSINAKPVATDGDGNPIPNPQQNVFLLALNFPGGDALQNDSSHYTQLIADLVAEGEIDPAPDREEFPGETPTFDLGIAFQELEAAVEAGSGIAAAAQKVLDFNNQYRAEVVSLDGGTNNVLRISPLEPLDPKTKYLVVVTDEVKDSTGEPLIASPTYQTLRDPDGALPVEALAGVRSAIQGWEQLAAGYFGALTNPTREASGLPALEAGNTSSNGTLEQNDVALTLTFTTGGTTDVMEAATSPAQFFYKNGVKDTRQEGIAKYLANNADSFEDLDAATQFGTLNQVADNAVSNANASAPTLKDTAAGTAANLAGNGADFSNPKPRTVTPFNQAPPNGTRVPADAVNEQFNGNNTIFQGSIELPYYLGVPTETNPGPLDTSWKASSTVGSLLDAAQGNEEGTTPPSDNITYRFPFPGEPEMVDVPFIAFAPDPAASCGSEYDVVIYQHGIFGNRSHSLALGNQLANNCYVTVAIDLPMHGIAPKLATGEIDPSLGLSVDVTQNEDGSFDESSLPVSERHFGWGQDSDGNPTRMQYSTEADEAVGSSAQFFLNLGNLPAARDNIRQGVIDLLNLNASMVNFDSIDIDGDGSANDTNFGGDASKLYFVGHSLGGIIGTSFVSLANQTAQEATIGNGNIEPIAAASLVTPGAGITKLLENSPSLGGTILAGLQEANSTLVQGRSNLELYFRVAQGQLDSVEPHNYASMLTNSSTPIYLNEIYGDGAERTTQDQTIPIAADTKFAGPYTAPRGNALPAPLAGTEPLIGQLNATTIPSDGSGVDATGANVVRFTDGTHSTIIRPEDAQGEAVFADMAQNIITFFANDGSSIGFNNGQFVKDNEPSPDNP